MTEPYPELAKMRAVREESATLTRFVDWLEEQGVFLCETNTETRRSFGGEYERISDSYEHLFARYFEIDLNKVESERRALLDAQRKLNHKDDAP